MSASRVPIILLAAALLLGGCASPSGSETPAPTDPTSSPTAEPQQERETGLTAPARPFDGDCASMFSDADLEATFGTSMSRYENVNRGYFAPDYLVELHAGMRCEWMPSDGGYSWGLMTVVLPENVVDYSVANDCDPGGQYSTIGAPNCRVESVANGSRLSGHVWSEAGVDVARAAATRLVEIFAERASASTPAPAPIPAVGAWALPVDCVAVVAAGDFSAVPGLGATVEGSHTGGTDFPFPPAESALWGGLGMPYCSVAAGDVYVTFVASGGGRWLETTVASTAAPYALEGYEATYTSPAQLGLTRVDVFDGVNWLHFQVKFLKNAKPLADALFAALNTTGAP